MYSTALKAFSRRPTLASSYWRTNVNQRYFSSIPEKMEFTLALPYQVLHDKEATKCVVIPGSAGTVGVLAGHVPLVVQLVPGVLVVHKDSLTEATKKYFVAGGFAVINEESKLSINVTEAVPLDQLDESAVRDGLHQQKDALAKATDQDAQAEAKIGIYVHEAMLHALEKNKV